MKKLTFFYIKKHPKRLAQPDGGCRLSLPKRRRRDAADHHVAPVLLPLQLAKNRQEHLHNIKEPLKIRSNRITSHKCQGPRTNRKTASSPWPFTCCRGRSARDKVRLGGDGERIDRVGDVDVHRHRRGHVQPLDRRVRPRCCYR